MNINAMFESFWRRFLLATLLWAVAWPALWYVKIGEITGPKAWFWIIGELNYPVVAIAFIFLDDVLGRFGLKSWLVFAVTVVIIAMCMPFYYERFGFTLGVSLEARLF